MDGSGATGVGGGTGATGLPSAVKPVPAGIRHRGRVGLNPRFTAPRRAPIPAPAAPSSPDPDSAPESASGPRLPVS
ncbi:hypothetical protein C5N14_29275 [Micromonospora sp. MW-13]|nr:hypothetical protein C5N14_29275 [Micromonospora sp. MW-13]